jgi:hypothetical protein
MKQLSPAAAAGFAKLLPADAEEEEEGDDGDPPPSKSTSGIIRK